MRARLETAKNPTSATAVHFQNGIELKLLSDPRVFRPTLTTWNLIDYVMRDGVFGKTVLDLGCGSGPIAISLARVGAAHVHAVDLMREACTLAMKNSELNGVSDKITILRGDLFEPLGSMKFDVIVDDVSGVAEAVARYSTWFPDGVPSGGIDGTIEAMRMLEQCQRHLSPRGIVYFPVLSLSNASKIVETATAIFGARLRRLTSKLVPFNYELRNNLAALEELKNQGLIDFFHVRSRLCWRLDIYKATV